MVCWMTSSVVFATMAAMSGWLVDAFQFQLRRPILLLDLLARLAPGLPAFADSSTLGSFCGWFSSLRITS